MMEIEWIVDDYKRYEFEELREKVLSHTILDINDILDEAEMLVNPQKKDHFQTIKFIIDDQNALEEKLQKLIEMKKAERMKYSGAVV